MTYIPENKAYNCISASVRWLIAHGVPVKEIRRALKAVLKVLGDDDAV